MSLEQNILKAFFETLYMVFIAGSLAAALGTILGIYIFACKNEQILNKKNTYKILSFIVNIMRSIPFIILMVFIMPLTRILTGTSIGTTASLVPLTIAAIPLSARLIENSLSQAKKGLIETAKALGASPWQIIKDFLWPESLYAIIHGFTLLIVNLIGYCAMAGAIGGGGLGDLAIRYGYQRFDLKVMFITVIILIMLVEFIQYIGEKISHKFKKG